jgi:hypothetical protein
MDRKPGFSPRAVGDGIFFDVKADWRPWRLGGGGAMSWRMASKAALNWESYLRSRSASFRARSALVRSISRRRTNARMMAMFTGCSPATAMTVGRGRAGCGVPGGQGGLRVGVWLAKAGLGGRGCGLGAFLGPSPLPLPHRMGEGVGLLWGRNPGWRSFLAGPGLVCVTLSGF